MAEVDLIQAQAEVATRNEDRVVAQYTLDQLQDEMKKRISSDVDPGLVLARLNPVESVRQPGHVSLMPLDDAIQFALQNRAETKQADYDLQSRDIDVRFTKNQTLPVFAVSAGFEHLGLGGTQTIRSGIGTDSEVVRVIPGGIEDMFKQLFEFRFPGYTAGFNLRIPLGNNAAKADYRRALNERELSSSRKAALAQRIVLEVRNAHTQIVLNDARVATARTARILSARRLEAEQAKFQAGASTVRFVLEEQRNLAQAETNEIQALVNYTKAIVAYDEATGYTLERNNIALDRQMPPELASRN
jgi:outer membrane protein TolC